jgi:hypothetical protein
MTKQTRNPNEENRPVNSLPKAAVTVAAFEFRHSSFELRHSNFKSVFRRSGGIGNKEFVKT